MINVNDYNWNNISVGASKYDFIMNRFSKVDVSADEEFQKKFTGFYRIRRNKELFLKRYYSFMESLKGEEASFEEIIRTIHDFQGTIEPSFSSKMLATLNPDMPVWDRYVLSNAEIAAPKQYNVTFEKCIATYEKVVAFYAELLKTDVAQEMLRLFDEKLPEYKHFSKTKKIDLMLWQKR